MTAMSRRFWTLESSGGPTGVIRHTQKEDPTRSNKKVFTALSNFIYPDAILFRQIENEETFQAIRIKLTGKLREHIIIRGEKMQIQIFNLIYTTFRKLCLLDEISKIKESDTVREQATAVRALRAGKGLNGPDQSQLGPHTHTP